MFALTQKYLYAHYDPETGETNGNAVLLQLCMRYQRVRYWWRWRKEQPGLHSLSYTLRQMVRVAVTKATL